MSEHYWRDRIFRHKKWVENQRELFEKNVEKIVRHMEPHEIWPTMGTYTYETKPIMYKVAVRYFDTTESKYKWIESGIHDCQADCLKDIEDKLQEVGSGISAVDKGIKYKIPMMWHEITSTIIADLEKRKKEREEGNPDGGGVI